MSTEQATVEQQEQWLEEPAEPELPRRPRRRLLTPIPLALMGVLLIACGFIGGVLVEKGQNSSGSSGGGGGAAGLPRALPLCAPGPPAVQVRAGTGARPGSGAGRGGRRLPSGGSAGARRGRSWRPTAGTVAYLDGLHPVCDKRGRQHGQGQDFGRIDGEQDGQIRRQKHPSRGNRDRDRQRKLGRSRPGRIDPCQRSRCKRRSGRSLRRRSARRLGLASNAASSSRRGHWVRRRNVRRGRRTRAIRGLAMQEWFLEKGDRQTRSSMPTLRGNRRPLTNPDTMPEDCHRQRSSMPHTNTRGRKPAIAVVVVLLLASLGLSACGGSSGSSSNATSSSCLRGQLDRDRIHRHHFRRAAASTTPSAPGSARGSARFAAIRECLQKNGVTLPQRTPGSGAPGGGFPGAGGGPTLPKGVTRAQYEAALKKCGGGNFGARSGRRGGAASGAATARVQGSAHQVRRHVCARTASTCRRRTPLARGLSSIRRGSTPTARSSRPPRRSAVAHCWVPSGVPPGHRAPLERRHRHDRLLVAKTAQARAALCGEAVLSAHTTASLAPS